jgi:hypothetical protein
LAGAAFFTADLEAVFLVAAAAPEVAFAVRRPITLRAAVAVRAARERVLVRAIELAFLVARAAAVTAVAARNRIR